MGRDVSKDRPIVLSLPACMPCQLLTVELLHGLGLEPATASLSLLV